MPLPTTLPGLLVLRSRLVPERVALIDGDGRALTYGEWQGAAEVLADRLVRAGVKPGDRVAISGDNRRILALATGYVAIQRAGGAAVVLSSELGPAESAAMRDAAGCRAGFEDLVDTDVSTAEPSRDDPVDCSQPDGQAQVLFTSGSTGLPKAVGATHRHLLAAFEGQVETDADRLAEAGTFVHALPFGTNAGQSMLMTCLVQPDVTVVLPKFDPHRFADAVAAHAAFGTMLVPAMASLLVAHGAELGPRLATLTDVGLTGAAASPRLLGKLGALLSRAEVTNYYTSTEAWPASVATVFDPLRAESVGRPQGRTSVAIDQGGRPTTAAGVWGEILLANEVLAGRTTFGATAEQPVTVDGWVRTGDLGHLDDDGYLYVEARLSSLISTGGYKVVPAEVERVALAHGSVRDVVVFGAPHELLGELVAAAVVWEDGDVTGTLLDHLRQHLTPHKVPSTVMSLGALPLTPAAKVDVDALRERHMAVGRANVHVRVIGEWDEPLPDGVIGRIATAERADRWLRPDDLAGLDPGDYGVELLGLCRRTVANDAINGCDTLLDVGADSLCMIEIQAAVDERWAVELPLELFFGTLAIDEIAGIIHLCRTEGA